MTKLLVSLTVVLLWCSAVKAQTPFYQGKTVTILVGTKAGDVYDLYPRLLAEFWPKHIPGGPNIIVQTFLEPALSSQPIKSTTSPNPMA